VVYFSDPMQWFERAVALDRRQEFLERVEAKLDQIEGPIVLISSRTSDEEAEVDDRTRLVRILKFRCLDILCRHLCVGTIECCLVQFSCIQLGFQ
jgi:hypothetical protein